MKFITIGNMIFNMSFIKRVTMSGQKIYVYDENDHLYGIDFGGEIDAKKAFDKASMDLVYFSGPMTPVNLHPFTRGPG